MQFVASATSALVSIAVALIALLQKGSPDDVDTTSVAVMYSFLIPYYMAFVAQYAQPRVYGSFSQQLTSPALIESCLWSRCT